MADTIIIPIVEGHGEVEAVPMLLRSLWYPLGGVGEIHVLKPIRKPRSSLVIEERTRNYVEFAARKLAQQPSSPHKVILILLDADTDLPCQLGPKLVGWATTSRSDLRCMCVVANREYETWFAASAESLIERGLIKSDARIVEHPETDHVGKAWVKRWIAKGTYSETTDQAKLSAALDIALARRRAPSFDKLCRELESLARESVAPG